MVWNYSGDPADSTRDEVRFLIGDTDENDQLVQDGEINYAIAQQSSAKLAASLVLRALAAKYSRMSNVSVGDVSNNAGEMAKAFAERANELDPSGMTLTGICLPKFGGLTISGKETLDSDTDAVQPSFRRGMNDISGGPTDSEVNDD